MTSLFEVPSARGTALSAPDVDDLLQGLNPAQRRAVAHRGSPLLVVAGAGSGKTRVLTRRVAYLLATGAARPSEILAITFTNKAAAEMKGRVADQAGPQARSIWVSTFHSLCVRILRAEASHLAVKSTFTIYDSSDSQRLVAIVAKNMNLDIKKFTPRSLLAAVSNHKNELRAPADAGRQADSDYETLVAEVYDGYQQRLVAAGAYDFDDLIMQTVLLLRSMPGVAEHYRRRFRHVMVDEYQDTNHAQYALVRELVGPGTSADSGAHDDVRDDYAVSAQAGLAPAELVVVGDADQSIYAFRGATIRNITEFEHDYPNATTVLLEQNYRSTQTILSAANAVIARNSQRRAKSLWTSEGSGEKIVGYVGDDEHDEARFISGEIDRLCDAGDISYGDVAVFYRTNAASRAIEDVFVRSGMPYRIVGGVRFYERKEIKDALAYLRVVANPADEVSLRRIINTPKRGIGDRALAAVAEYAARERIAFADALARYGDVAELATRSATAIGRFLDLLGELDGVLDGGGDPADVVTAVLERTGYRQQLAASDDPQDESRLENLEQLVTVLREQAENALLARDPAVAEQADDAHRRGDDSEVDGGAVDDSEVDGGEADGSGDDVSSRELLGIVLERLSLVADADSVPDSDEGVVTLMTLHTAKGLEFPVVFLTGLEDGMFPHQRAMGSEQELAEERRLAYVGITRARRRLYVSRAVGRSAWGQPIENPPSRFLDELPDDLVDWRRLPEVTDPFTTRSGDFDGWGGGGRSAPVSMTTFGGRDRNRSRARRPAVAKGTSLRLVVGDKVNHDKYGLGTVQEVSGAGSLNTAVIDFGTSGTVRMVLNGSAPMTKL